jgi:hypothetical protein
LILSINFKSLSTRKTCEFQKMNTFLWRSTKTANLFTFKVGHDTRFLVKIDPITSTTSSRCTGHDWHISVWDICQPGAKKIISKPLDLVLQIENELKFSLDLCAILVSKSTAVLCFKVECPFFSNLFYSKNSIKILNFSIFFDKFDKNGKKITALV